MIWLFIFKKESMRFIEIYTDWSCLWNPWVWWRACLLSFDNKTKKIYWNKFKTTNNQMELQAIIEWLKAIKTQKYSIKIYTDSIYAKNWITKRIENWKKNNRRNSSKKEVKNKELWIELDKLVSKFNIQRHWVKAHSTNKMNNIVDELARNSAALLKSKEI